jgi:hypothetical protein
MTIYTRRILAMTCVVAVTIQRCAPEKSAKKEDMIVTALAASEDSILLPEASAFSEWGSFVWRGPLTVYIPKQTTVILAPGEIATFAPIPCVPAHTSDKLTSARYVWERLR